MTLPTLAALAVLVQLFSPNAAAAFDGASFVVLAILTTGLLGVFQKAGRSGWQALTPVLCEVELLRVNGQSAWWIVLLLGIDVATLLIGPTTAWVVLALILGSAASWAVVGAGLRERFRRGMPFFIGLIVFPWIFVPILGFGRSVYHPPRR